jgi:DNA-binding transcriptional ArsR family regulator
VWRLELQPQDLLTARFETRPGPIDDIMAVGRALRRRRIPWLADWHRTVAPQLPTSSGIVLALVPPTGPAFDFEVPPGASLDEAMEWILTRPRPVLAAFAEHFVELGPIPVPVRGVADGHPASLEEVSAGMRSLYAIAVEPYRPQIDLVRDADVASRSQQTAAWGLAATINDLHPSLRLHGMTLELDRPFDHTVRSPGHGLILVPSPWLHDEVRVQWAADQPTVLAYPARIPLVTRKSPNGSSSLGRLLGETRARLMAALAGDRAPGTMALAAEIRISPATASEHLAVLRAAQLVVTHRARGATTHRLTPAGRQLLALNLTF